MLFSNSWQSANIRQPRLDVKKVEAQALNDFTPEVARAIFKQVGLDFDAAEDLQGFENFVYGVGDSVVRITHHSHRSPEQVLCELEFVGHLAKEGASVAAPLTLPDGELVGHEGNFVFARFQKSPGVAGYSEPFSDSLIREWGRCIGEFHRLAAGFKPAYPRYSWLEDENHDFEARIPGQATILEIAADLKTRLLALPKSPDVYGLIHGDAHAGNFFVDDGRLTFFDFDDVSYSWFGYDVATILFGVVLQPWVTPGEEVAAAEKFLVTFLEGYSRENDTAALMLPSFPDLLKLRELSLYAVIHLHMDVENIEDDFAARFMDGRRKRLEGGVPYLDMGFG